MRKKGGRVKKADGGAYVGTPANYQPGFVQSAFGTGNLPHLQTAGMMATGDTARRTNDYLQGKFAFDPSGTRAVGSPQAGLNQQVENAYRYYLDRPADQAGSEFWRGQMANGMDTTGLAKSLQASPEYANRWGVPQGPRPQPQEILRSQDPTSAGQLIDQMYINTLGRLPDDAGKAFWLQQLNAGISPTEIGNLIEGSQEGGAYGASREFERRADEMAGRGQYANPLQQSQNYFAAPRAPGAMPGSMVPSLQFRNAEQLRYQMSPEGIAADEAMNAQELAEKKEIMAANQEWDKAEAERLEKLAAVEAEQAAAKAREDEIERQRAAAAAAHQQAMMMLMMMMR